MNRRIWIKEIMLAGGGLILLPACMHEEGATSVALKNFAFTRKEEALLADLAEAIIPATNTPGAKALNLHHFVLKMFDDCYDAPEQKGLASGWKTFDDFAKKTTGKNFHDLADENKLVLLRAIRDNKVEDDIRFFLSQTRRQVVRGYETSEYVLTKLVPYQLIPGHFYGAQPINKSV